MHVVFDSGLFAAPCEKLKTSCHPQNQKYTVHRIALSGPSCDHN